MDWDRFDRIANRSQIPLTVGGYVGWAYTLWPRDAVLFGSPKDVNWTAALAASIFLLGLISIASQVGWLRSIIGRRQAQTPALSRPQLVQLRTPSGLLGEANDILAEIEHKFGQLESSYWQVIDHWNGWLKAAKEAEGRQIRQKLTWDQAFPEAISGVHRARIAAAVAVFVRRLNDLHELMDKHFGGTAVEEK